MIVLLIIIISGSISVLSILTNGLSHNLFPFVVLAVGTMYYYGIAKIIRRG